MPVARRLERRRRQWAPLLVVALALGACHRSSSDGTHLPDGGFCNDGGCSAGQICSAGTCQPGCSIGAGQFLNGAACNDAGAICFDGICELGCSIGGNFILPGGLNPANGCQSCQPLVALADWSPLSGVDPSGFCDAGTCDQGSCGRICLIGGQARSPATLDPTNTCQACQPEIDRGAWSGLPDGTRCGPGVCFGGACRYGCVIGGQFYAPGAISLQNNCQMCVPATDPEAWTPQTGPADGGCAGGEVCQQGACTPGCFLESRYVTPGSSNSANPAQCCNPTKLSSGWTPLYEIVASYPTRGDVRDEPIVIGDFDGDGRPDIAIVNRSPPEVDLYWNRGARIFSGPDALPLLFTPGALDTGDLNGDGRADLILFDSPTDGGWQVGVLLSLEDGGFSSEVGYPVESPRSLRVADLNGDGFPDIVVASLFNAGFGYQYGGASVLLNLGDGRLGPAIIYDAGAGPPIELGIGDFNADGFADVALSFGGASVSVLLNDRQGGFPTFVSLPIDMAVLEGPDLGLAAGGFNGDQLPDLMLCAGKTVDILSNQGGGKFAHTATYVGSSPSYLTLGLGDLNGDGLIDGVLRSDSDDRGIDLLVNQGQGQFRIESLIPGGPESFGTFARALAVADLDGDGTPEIVFQSGDGGLEILGNACH